MTKTCKKCGKAFRGYGAVCDCIMEDLDYNRKGQKSIFADASQQSEMEEFMAYARNLFNLPPEDKPVPEEAMQKWLKARTMVRKSKDDWTSLKALHRDFTEWTGSAYTLSAFETALRNAGFGMRMGMASRLILKVDLQMTISERYGTIAV